MTNITPAAAAQAVVDGLLSQGGKFISWDGKVSVLVDGKRIEINPDFDNPYAALQIEHCDIATSEYKGRSVCQRVAVLARKQAQSIRLASFSALSADKQRIYLPVKHDKLLLINSQGIKTIPNGSTEDSVWLEHPARNAFDFEPEVDVQAALRQFEELCVSTQACSVPDHAWLVAMHEAFLPYVRNYLAARMLVEHIGPSQHGKTSGAQRFTKLHGLGEVLGDVSVAYLRNSCHGLGLMALDNKEQASYRQDLIDVLLFAATGAKHGRSMQDGSAREMGDRPIVVLTSIEGLYKQELQNRTICIPYGTLTEEHRDRDLIEEQIERYRNSMLSGLCFVLRQFLLTDREETRQRLAGLPPNPWPEFGGYVETLARLLYAYCLQSGRPASWADGIIATWFGTLGSATIDREEDALESHIQQVLMLYDAVLEKQAALGDLQPVHFVLLQAFECYKGYEMCQEKGILYVTTAGNLLGAMKQNRIGTEDLPKTPKGMSRRLSSGRWVGIRVLRESDDRVRLARSSNRRPIGIFVPGKGCDQTVMERIASVGGPAREKVRSFISPKNPLTTLATFR